MPNKLILSEVRERLLKNRIIILDEYVNVKHRNTFQCLECDHIWNTQCRSILVNGSGCPQCKSSQLTNEVIDERLAGRNIRRIGEYKNKRSNILWECEVCKYQWKSTPGNVVINKVKSGCPRCATKFMDNYTIDKRLVEENRNIQRIGNFTDLSVGIEWKCLDCGCIWKGLPSNILYKKSGCPACINKGEKQLHIFIKRNIDYEQMVYHHVLNIYGKKVIVDFLLHKGNRKIIIERNGEQHYKPVRFGGMSKKRAEMNFIRQKRRDKILERWCQRKNYELIIIPYYISEEEMNDKLLNI